MVRRFARLATALLSVAGGANAATFLFDDPTSTPGREVNFNIGTDTLTFDLEAFGVCELNFVNDLSTNLPSSGVNFIALQNPGPLNARSAAQAMAAQVTDAAPGFFIYVNTNLDCRGLCSPRT